MKKIIIGLLVLSGIGQPILAQDVEVRLTLRDGNTMAGTTRIPAINLITDYGKLEVPVKNVSSIRLGISADKSSADKVISLVKQLSNASEEVRKNSYNELSNMDIRSIPALSDFIYSSKYEPGTYTDYTPEAALSELKAKYNVAEDVSSKDVLTIDGEYTMGGTYDFKKIDLKTEYGTLSIPKEKIQHIDVMYSVASEGEMVFKLHASKHISANLNGGWLKTGITVKPGQQINITASGEVSFASLSGTKYKPDGTVSGAAAGYEYGYEGDYNYNANTAGAAYTYPTYGNVVYKIGEMGVASRAGAKFTGTAGSGGMLYLSIYETVYNPGNTGSYTVKLSVK